MTVADNTSRNQYTATSGQTVFAYTFEIVDKDDIVVLKNGTTLSEGTNYTVSNVGNDSGGNVTLTAGATAGDILTLYRDMPYARTQNYTNSGDFLASEVNSDFDNLWLAGEQTNRSFSQSIRKPITDSDSISMELPEAADRTDSFLTFDSTGAVSTSPLSSALSPSIIVRQQFTGNGSTTVFTLAADPGSPAGVVIYIDGVYQEEGTYSVSGSTVTFTEAPPTNASIEVVSYKTTAVGTTDANSVTYLPAGTGAVQTTVQTKLRESVSVKDFGAVGDGVTDDTAAIQAAATYALSVGADLYFDPNITSEYLVVATSAGQTLISGLSDIRLYGAGRVRFKSLTPSDSVVAVNINGSDVTVSGVDFIVESESSSSLLFGVSTGSNLRFENNRFSTSSFTTKHNASILKLGDNAQCPNGIFAGNICTSFNYGIFTANAFGANGNTGYAYNWNISDNIFNTFSGDAVELNTSDLESTPADRPWRYVVIDGNTIVEKTTGGTNIAIGTDGGAYITISNNTIANITADTSSLTAAIHIENSTEGIVVNGNVLRSVYGGVEISGSVATASTYGNIAITGNTITGPRSEDYSTLASAFAAKSTQNKIGVNLLVDGTYGSADGVTVQSNIIRNFDVAIKVGDGDRDISVTNNHISLCYTGLDISNYARETIDTNIISHSKYVIGRRGGYSNIGHNKAINCYRLFDTDFSGTFFGMTGLTWVADNSSAVALASIPSGSTSQVDLFEVPTEFGGRLSGFATAEGFRGGLRDNFLATVSFDGTTITQTRDLNRAVGAFAISGSPLAQDGTFLELQVFQASGSNKSIELNLVFNNFMLWL